MEKAPGPVVLVGNEIGLGSFPGPRSTRLVDALGLVNQQAAQACERVTLMAAGLPLFPERCTMKPTPVKRILIVLAVLLALVLAMATLAQAEPMQVVDDRPNRHAFPHAAAHRQPAAVADRDRVRAGRLRTPGGCGPLFQLACQRGALQGVGVGWTRTSRPSWRCGPMWC